MFIKWDQKDLFGRMDYIVQEFTCPLLQGFIEIVQYTLKHIACIMFSIVILILLVLT